MVKCQTTEDQSEHCPRFRNRPIFFLIFVLDLKPLSILNLIYKYANDTSLLTPQHTNTELEEEFLHIQSRVKENRLKINTLKTKEIVFRRPSLWHYVSPTPIVQIEQVEEVKLLGVIRISTLSANLHLNDIVGIINQRLYLLNQLRRKGLDINGVAKVFLCIVVACFLYALHAFSGMITADDTNRINAVFL